VSGQGKCLVRNHLAEKKGKKGKKGKEKQADGGNSPQLSTEKTLKVVELSG
jgi:hypothetical protein